MSWYTKIFRKVHWDFDTPEYIRDVGEKFSPREFIEKLRRAKVQAVQFYAKGADGYCFYDTKVGRKHPHLEKDLLGEVSVACRENGIKVMFYYSCCVDNYIARSYPEWGMNDGEKNLIWDACNCGLVCINSPYTDEIVLPQLEELTRNYPVDGFFLDHVWEFPCYCSSCQRKFKKLYNSSLPEDKKDPLWCKYTSWRHKNTENFLRKCARLIHKIKPDVVVGCNGMFSARHPRPAIEEVDYLLAEAEGGQACSFQARYLSTLEKSFDVMNTRFLYSWGDWMLKPVNVIQEDFATILANGGRCFIGDKMYPEGKLEPEVYRCIGQGFEFVNEREKICENLSPVAYIGVLHSSSTFYQRENARLGTYRTEGITPIQGAHKALMEGNFHFGILNEDTLLQTINSYHTLILPDQCCLSKQVLEHIKEFVYNGGTLIASYKSSLFDKDGKPTDHLQLADVLGVEYEKECPYPYNYVKAKHPTIKANIGNLPLLVHGRFLYTRCTTATALASVVHPFAPEHAFARFAFGDAPPGRETPYPAVILNCYGKGKAVYISGQIFSAFWEKRQVHLRYLVKNLVNLITENKTIDVDAPPCVEVSFLKGNGRYVVHLVNHGSRMADIYEILSGTVNQVNDYIMPVSRIEIKVKLTETPDRVIQMPEKRSLHWQDLGDYIHVIVPEVYIHSMIVFEMRK